MFESGYGEWELMHEPMYDARSAEHPGRTMGGDEECHLEEFGVDYIYYNNNDKDRWPNKHRTLDLSRLAAASANELPRLVNIQDYDEVLNSMPQDKGACASRDRPAEIKELEDVGSSLVPIKPGVHQFITRQALDSFPAIRGHEGVSHNTASSQNPSKNNLTHIDPGLRHFSDSHLGFNEPWRLERFNTPMDAGSNATSEETRSVAVFSTSSYTGDHTPDTSPQQSRRWTNSTQNAQLQGPSTPDNETTCHCGKEFDTPSARRKHGKHHSKAGDRPHKCRHCRLDFNDLRDLRRHLHKKHPENQIGTPLARWKTVNCESCGQECSRSDGVPRHLEANAETCGAYYKAQAVEPIGPFALFSVAARNRQAHVSTNAGLARASIPTATILPAYHSGANLSRASKSNPPSSLCPAMGDTNIEGPLGGSGEGHYWF